MKAELAKKKKELLALQTWAQTKVEEEDVHRQEIFVELDQDVDALNPDRHADFSKIGSNPNKVKDHITEANQSGGESEWKGTQEVLSDALKKDEKEKQDKDSLASPKRENSSASSASGSPKAKAKGKAAPGMRKSLTVGKLDEKSANSTMKSDGGMSALSSATEAMSEVSGAVGVGGDMASP